MIRGINFHLIVNESVPLGIRLDLYKLISLSGSCAVVKDTLSIIQPVWGLALLAMGVAFFFQIPDIMSRISEISYFYGVLTFMRICLYIMSILLVGGGIRKLKALKKKK
jgi:hypothetical protein